MGIQEPADDANIFTKMLQKRWGRSISEDDAEFDVELLAAYAEGEASPAEAAEAQALIASSPVALECYTAMREEVIVERSGEAGTVVAANRALVADSTEADLKHSSRMPVVMAASVLISCMSAGWAIWSRASITTLQNEVASLRLSLNQAEEHRIAQAILSTKEQAVTLASQRGQPFFAGKVSPGMLQTATLQSPIAKGPGDTLRVDPKLAESLGERWNEAISNYRAESEESLPAMVENGYLLLSQAVLENADFDESDEEVEARFSNAADVLKRLKVDYPDLPESKNFEAVLLLTKAPYLTKAAAILAREEAKTLLLSVTESHPDFAEAWLNMALLVMSDEGLGASKPYWERYEALIEDPAQSSVINNLLQ